ncbi:MAG: YcaO-like family protein [Pseudomonadota bacterium]
MSMTITLHDAIKTFTDDQDKIIRPEETVRRFKNKLAELDLDILEATQRIDSGRLGIPVYFSRCGKDARRIIGTRKQMGKGATPQQAEASAVMELAERFSFFAFTKDPARFITATAASLGETALPFHFIAQSVHDTTADLAAAQRIYEALPMKWTQAFNLTRGHATLVPFDWFFAINQFNGPSAGNCQEEAISQGICEIVERHVSALVSRGRLDVPAIDPAGVSDPAVKEMLGKYSANGIRLFISDFSLGTGIPTVGVMAYDPSTFPGKSEIIWTAGTTPDPEKALSRTLTEVAQLAGDFNTGSNFVASGLPKFGSLEEAAYITNPSRVVGIKDLPDISDDNIRVEIERAVAALADRGMDVLLIDTRHPRLDVPAFYTIVPGAHFRERAAGTSVGMFAAKHITESLAPRQALARLTAVDAELPGKYYVKFYMGQSLIAAGAPDKALTLLTEAARLDPPDQEAASIYAYTGVALKALERYEAALEALSRAERLDAERTDVHNLKGFCYFKLKAHEKAIESFKKVIALDPSSAIDYANIASNYRDLGDREKAIQFYETALALDPGIGFALTNLMALRKKNA